MRWRAIILYWLLLLVPTVFVGTWAFRLIRHEQERMASRQRRAMRERIVVIADSLQTAVTAVQTELSEALGHVPEKQLPAALIDWERHNPLIRNVFVWDPRQGLRYPSPAMISTREEQEFLSRYNALLSGRVAWESAVQEPTGPEPQIQEGERVSLKVQKSRKALVNLARGKGAPPPAATGWIPWFTANQLHILGWARQNTGTLVYGVELEFMVLLSRLIALFPDEAGPGCVYALLDGQGRVVHQAGDTVPHVDDIPEEAISLAPCLPHWQVAVYWPGAGAPGSTGRGFLLLSGLLIVLFASAILLGGSLLTWQAWRNMRDARRKTSFVSNISHELKTPLTSIRMYAELLQEDRVKEESKRRHYLGVIASESQRLTRLVNNVLDFGRLEEGRKTYEPTLTDITAFLRDFLDAHGLRIRKAGLALEVNLPDNKIPVLCDRDAVEQALLNLVDNAIKYARNGAELTVQLEPGTDACRICILDRGPGIPSAHRKKIFEKFHRVDDSLAARQPGSGLGLSIARALLRGMDGDLLYKHRDGGGSCFVVVIPYSDEGQP